MKRNFRRCARCGKELSLEGKPSRGSTCPGCGAYLRSCVNCVFYSPGRHNDCREPQAEHVGDKESANFCDYFRFREGVASGPGVQAGPGHGKYSPEGRGRAANRPPATGLTSSSADDFGR